MKRKTLDEKANEVAKYFVKVWGDPFQVSHPGRLHDYFAAIFKRGYNWRIKNRKP
jgi:hypothetical protein